MQNNVREAFAPLGMRLYFFEADLHLLADNEFESEINRHDFFYHSMIDKIGRDVNRYDPVEVYELSIEYAERAVRVQSKFEEQKSPDDNITPDKWKMWNDEISEYLFGLLAILEARKDVFQWKQSESNNIPSQITIRLPENFTIKEMRPHFNPRIHHSVIALLMYYMREVGIFPPYDGGEFGKIAPIFGFHGKTIAKDFRDMNTNSKADLTKVKELLEAVLSRISGDLAKTRNR